MIKRTLYFGNPYRLNVEKEQLVITDKKSGEVTQVPIEDIGFVMLDHPQLTYTQKVFQKLTSHNAVVIVCDEKHLPAGILLPNEGHQLQAKVQQSQVNASVPQKKQLWKQTVKAKIRNQIDLLKRYDKNPHPLTAYVRNIKSGDTTGEESKAARVYWQRLFKDIHFRRERSGLPPNDWLNYGYIVLRSATARALVGSGLLTSLGIHHRNQYNAYQLADDVMEPYRPFVDHIVYDLYQESGEVDDLDQDVKQHLLQIMAADVVMNKKKSPLMIALQQTTASLAQCFTGERKTLKYPVLPSS